MRYIRFCGVAAVAAAMVTGLTSGPATAAEPDRVPCSGTALSLAIATARNGETIDLRRDCTYLLGAALPTIGKDLTIRGNGATILRDGTTASPFRIFDINSNGNLRLQDLTVRGGYLTSTSTSGDGAGIRVNGGALRLSKVDVLDNTAVANGGGIAVESGGSADIRSSYVAFNNASNGAGLYTAGTVTVENSEFARNHARASGGGIYQSGGSIFVGTSVIRRNTAAGSASGGGVYIAGSQVTEIVDSKITNNTDTGTAGGGIYNNGNLKLTKSEVSGNVVGGFSGQGGGIYNSGTLYLRGTDVFRNSANGGGSSVGGGIYINSGTVTLDHSTVRNNASTVAPGGVRTTVPITLRDSTITRNIPTNCAPLVFTGCTD
ncbi:right-handed parallel beta-helix repeat-containing protein [Streptomyces sp. NPDC001980]|uniref:right-handed parallel beta-helix repeat-containing protein n=1 Tax=Streptomyces sp. NPDC001980 TaxID=3157126 RepID=UPI00332CEB62